MKSAFSIVALFLCVMLCGCNSDSSSDSDDSTSQKITSDYFDYPIDITKGYSGFIKDSVFVEMSDGVALAVDVFIPTIESDGTLDSTATFPTIFSFTPYNRNYIDLSTGEITGSHAIDEQFFLPYGYVVVVADQRGCGASFGSQAPFSDILGQDGKELIDWIADQSWSNGNVGMQGGSDLGWIQPVIAAKKPAALKCIIPDVINFEPYTGGVRPGGIIALNWIDNYSQIRQGFNLNVNFPSFLLRPSAPVIDEDNDGELADEIPVMAAGDPTTFLDDGAPTYADGSIRTEHYYYYATLSHTENIAISTAYQAAEYLDSILPAPYTGSFTEESSTGYRMAELMETEIPIYCFGGWFDIFGKGMQKMYATLADSNPAKMIIAPRFHGEYIPPPYAEFFNYEDDLTEQLNIEKLRFFDHYLKGIDNGIKEEPPVYIYVMNDGWRKEHEWPLERQNLTSYYFNEGNSLNTDNGEDGADVYQVDYTHNALYGTNRSDRWYAFEPPDSVMTRTDKDEKCLIYETPPLDEDVEITGHPIADIYVTSNQRYGDIYVYLTDVDENGESIHVSDGALRAGWHNLHDPDDQIDNVAHVLPELPWHGYKEEQWVDGPLDPEVPLNIKFDLFPTSWVFKKGHRIRIAIAGADYENFELNPGLGCREAEQCPDTTLTVHRTIEYPSHVVLPVIP